MSLLNTSLLIAFNLILSLNAGAQSTVSPAIQTRFHTYLTYLNRQKGFSGELLAARNGKVIFREAIGLASKENNEKLDLGARYHIASITKTFTASLIMLAQEEKKLSVNDKIIKHIKGLSDKFKDVTIHQLLTHSSGLPHNEGIQDYWQTKSKLQRNTEQVIVEISKLELLFKPGTRMNYSSPGYYLLATILENVYKDNFRNILASKILSKLKMAETGIANSNEPVTGNPAGYHLLTDDSLIVAPYRNYSMLKGAGDMFASADDLLKWSTSFYSGQLLSKQSRELLFTTNSVSSGSDKEATATVGLSGTMSRKSITTEEAPSDTHLISHNTLRVEPASSF